MKLNGMLIGLALSLATIGLLGSCKTGYNASPGGILSMHAFDENRNTIVFLGDSLTYGDGCQNPGEQSYPALVRKSFQSRGLGYHVINAGINGDTTTKVLDRMEPFLSAQTCLIALGIGVNDYVGEDSVDQIHERMRLIIQRILAKKIDIVLFKMEITFSGTQVPRFAAMYDELGKEFNIPVFAYMPAERLQERSLFADWVHPNQNGHRDIAGRLLKWLSTDLADDSLRSTFL